VKKIIAGVVGALVVVGAGVGLWPPITLPESAELRITRLYPGSLVKQATKSLLVARSAAPNWLENGSVSDTSVLSWTREVLHNL